MIVDPATIAAERFGIVGTATPLPGYADDNTRFDTADGTYVLKISLDTASVPLQDAVLDTINAATEYSASRVVHTTTLEDGRIARLLTWVDGRSFADTGRPASAARSIGIAAGTIVSALAGVEGGTAPGAPDWDLAHASRTIRAGARSIADERRRAIVLQVADLVDRVGFDSLPHQVIHNDLNDHNVLLADGEVVGIIDVGDALRTARIAELAIAVAYTVQHQADPVSVACDLIEGFASVVDVTAAEATAIWPLIMGRLATSVVKSASGPRDNPHRINSEAGGWDILERFDSGDAEAMCAELSTAAGH